MHFVSNLLASFYLMEELVIDLLNRLLIFLGATTILGGLTGFGGTTLPCCFKSHVIFMSIAIFGTSIFALVLFGQVRSLPLFSPLKKSLDSVF